MRTTLFETSSQGLKSGLEIYFKCECCAEPWREPDTILLLHGIGRSHKAWYGWVPVLATDLRVVRVDLPGFGATRRPPGHKWTLEGAVGELVELLDSLEIDDVHVAGSALGAALALAFASEAPSRVRTVTTVLHGATLIGNEGSNGRAVNQYAIIDSIRQDGVAAYAERAVPKIVGTAASLEKRQWAIEQASLSNAQTWMDAISAVADADVGSILRRIEAPTLVISPSRSPMVPLRNVYDTVSHIADCELVVLASDASDLTLARPRASARECLSFIHRKSHIR